MTSYTDLIKDISSFKPLKSPHVFKYITDAGEYAELKKINIINQKNSLQKQDMIVDHFDKNKIRYYIINTNFNRTHGYIQIDKNIYDSEKTISIIIRLRYGQQRDEELKYFYGNYTLIYKNYKLQASEYSNRILSKRLLKEAMLCGEKMMKCFKKYSQKL